MKYYSHNKMKEVDKDFSPKLISELKSFFVERYVDNMSTEDLVEYVTTDMDRYVDSQFDEDFLNDAMDYWGDHFDEVVEEIEEFANCCLLYTSPSPRDIR